MSESNPAIFLSYAHEDAEPARKIAEALRSVGVEVWFDTDELRGGDQWDAKIRRQIKNCALFLPIVSATTQARREAYFRLEWKLADDRTHMMAAEMAFIVPVVIDDTSEYEAKVPDSFVKAHFTRLPHGDPDQDFISHIKALAVSLEPALASSLSPPPLPGVRTDSQPTPASASKKSSAPLIVGMCIGGFLIAIALILNSLDGESVATPPASLVVENAASETTTISSNRLSIAVLPFANMSEDADGNSFFADGIHEDLLTNLAFVPELKVVSRTSVMQYRDTLKPVKQIAAELGVGTLLEGSVRRAGDQVRVTAQLIDASTDEHIWAQNYDRKLEDIFAIQGELAKAITDALRIALTREQADSFSQRPTENLAAYELFLKEQEFRDQGGNTSERQWQSIAMMEQAVELDPSFALAWAKLGELHAQAYFWGHDQTEERRDSATEAINQAIKLAPQDLDVKTYVGSYYYYGFRNYSRAAEYYQQVLDAVPNHIEALASMGYILRREGRWAESIHLHERVLELDPRNLGVVTALTMTYEMLRQWDKAVVVQQSLVDQSPGEISFEARLVQLKCHRDNSLQPFHDFVSRYPDLATSNHIVFWTYRQKAAIAMQDWELAIRMAADAPDGADAFHAITRAILYRVNGQEAECLEILEAELASLENISDKDLVGEEAPFAKKALALALLGQVDRAEEEVTRLTQLLGERDDAMQTHFGRGIHAMVQVWTASPTDAVQAMREHLKSPAGYFLPRFNMANEVWCYPLWGHPEFEALIADDEAWAPLWVE